MCFLFVLGFSHMVLHSVQEETGLEETLVDPGALLLAIFSKKFELCRVP